MVALELYILRRTWEGVDASSQSTWLCSALAVPIVVAFALVKSFISRIMPLTRVQPRGRLDPNHRAALEHQPILSDSQNPGVLPAL